MKDFASTLIRLTLLCTASITASAHVAYVDLSNPLVSPGGTNGGTFSDNGWYMGTTPTLGDSHLLGGGTYFKFHVSAPGARVTITFSCVQPACPSGALNPAFSLYEGLLPNDGHDTVPFDTTNPLNPFPPFNKIQSVQDDGAHADAYGRVSPFRNTVTTTYVGQFDALHSFSLANESNEWSVAKYLTHVPPTGGNSVSLNNYFLPAGDYTIAAAGGNTVLFNAAVPGTITLTQSPATQSVPMPAAALWLLGLGLGAASCLFRGRGRRG
jgi:hypothetical protein